MSFWSCYRTICQDLKDIARRLTVLESQTPAPPAPTPGDDWGDQVVESDATLTGDGTASSPLSVVAPPPAPGDDWGNQVVESDATLTGDGTAASPLSVVAPPPAPGDDWGNQVVESDSTLTGDGTAASPLSAVQQVGDGVTILGAGTPSSPFVAVGGGGGGGGDNWGTQVVESDATLIGNGTALSPLSVVPPTLATYACNGLSYKAGALYHEDFGYRIAVTFEDVQIILDQGDDVLICQELTQNGDTTWTSPEKQNIKFVKGGCINTQGFELQINVGIENPRNRHIFKNYAINEFSEGRYNAGAGRPSTVYGDFGGENKRYPEWWGLQTTWSYSDSENTSFAQKSLNVDAIFACSTSYRTRNGAGTNILVHLPAGFIPIGRTIKLAESQSVLEGSSLAYKGTQIHAWSDFDASFKINCESYPDGSSPMIEIGFLAGGVNPNPINDPPGGRGGFQSGVRHLSLVGPVFGTHAERISGVMWEAGLQEGTVLSYVGVQNWSGMAFGGPLFQRLDHNGPAQGYILQTNTVKMDNLWVFGASAKDAICAQIGGLNVNIDTCTFDASTQGEPEGDPNRGRMLPPPGFDSATSPNGTNWTYDICPVVVTAGRECINFTNIHLEQRLMPNQQGAGICVPYGGKTADRARFESVFYYTSVVASGTSASTLDIRTDRGGFVAESIGMNISHNFNGVADSWVAIYDRRTGKKSGGWHWASSVTGQRAGSWVAHYSRQETNNVVEILTSDTALGPISAPLQ